MVKSIVPTTRRFTLVELLVVLLIMAALAGVALATLSSVSEEARESAIGASLRGIQAVVVGEEGYVADLDYVVRVGSGADAGTRLPALRTRPSST